MWPGLHFVGAKTTVITAYSDCSFAPQGSRSRTGVCVENWPGCNFAAECAPETDVCAKESEAAATGLQDALRLKDH